MSSREILTSRETSTRPGSSISPGSKHGNTSMLKLNTTKAIKASLVTIGYETEGIPASEFGRCSSNFVVEGTIEGGRGLAGLDGGKGGSAGDEGGEDGGLHGDW